MIAALAFILALQLAGEAAARALDLPVPGPVLGFAALFVLLLARRSLPDPLEQVALTLLRHLSLMFVPAAAGIFAYIDRIGGAWIAVSIALVVSTLLTIAVSAAVFVGVKRLMGIADTEAADDV